MSLALFDRDTWIAAAVAEYDRSPWRVERFQGGAVTRSTRHVAYGSAQISATVVESPDSVTWEVVWNGKWTKATRSPALDEAKQSADAQVLLLLTRAADDAAFAHAMAQSRAPRPAPNPHSAEWGGGMTADHD